MRSSSGWLRIFLLLALAGLPGCFPGSPGPSDEQKEPHFMNGRRREAARDYTGAIEEFEKSLEANPRSAAAHFELGWLYDQQAKDYAVAIYHYQQHLRLYPTSLLGDQARDRIRGCKLELARNEVLGPTIQGLQKTIDQLSTENTKLKQELQDLKNSAANRTPAAGRAGGAASPGTTAATRAPVTIIRPETAPASSGTSAPREATASTAAVRPRTHTVKSGETATAIAKQYNVKLERLQSANPGANLRSIKVGQILNVPAS